MSTNQNPPAVNFFRDALRILLTVIIAVALGAGIYYGASSLVPWVQEQYIQPVRDNTSRLEDLRQSLEDHLARAEENFLSLTERLQTHDVQLDNLKATLDLSRSQMTALAQQNQGLQATLTVQRSKNRHLQDQIDTLSTRQAAQADHLSYLATQQLPRQAVVGETRVLVIMDLLSRAKSSLTQANYGLAASDLKLARKTLAALSPRLFSSSPEALRRVDGLLLTAQEALPEDPSAAADALDLSWRILAQGYTRDHYSPQRPTATASPPVTTTPQPTPDGE